MLKKIQIHHLLLASSLLIFIMIVSGGVLRTASKDANCQITSNCLTSEKSVSDLEPVSIVHKSSTLLGTLLVMAVAGMVWEKGKDHPQLRWSMVGSSFLLIFNIGLGLWMTFSNVEHILNWISRLHLVLSLLSLAIIISATVRYYMKSEISRIHQNAVYRRLAILSLVGVFLLMVSGSLISPVESIKFCNGWPLCGTQLIPVDGAGWLHFSHRLIVGAVGLLMIALLVQAWRSQRSQTVTLVASTAVTVLFFAQAILGKKLVDGFPAYMLILHQATATAIWGIVVILGSMVNFSKSASVSTPFHPSLAPRRSGLIRDLLLLTKPIVVALLLVTTFAGMVIGAQAWPSWQTVMWTMLAGFLAAGGSGAINQYIDREDDSKMQRTQKRPIPSGRLTPAEGLAAGTAMVLTSFYLMVAFVNWLAALLTLAGIIYYVLIYSIFLKKTTVQNIVIGGGAGAIPPLVGWAAATGSLNIPSLFLFAVIFMWTPPHFWALALVRQNDYARAGVPMLPVIRGARETRWQILIYTIELVVLTLLLPVFGLGSAIYLVGATVLGLWLLAAAWKVWKLGGNKLAWKMYRYSSMYLAFLFLVLMVDRLL